jgi:putative transposase
MRTRYRIHEAHATYFVTSTIVKWLPVFTTKACCDILVDSLLHGRTHRQLQIYAWVILDNHFHAILSGPDLTMTLGRLKRFTAHALLARIESEKRDWLINQFAYFRAAHKKRQEHQVWQEGVHPQQIDSDEVMQQWKDAPCPRIATPGRTVRVGMSEREAMNRLGPVSVRSRRPAPTTRGRP